MDKKIKYKRIVVTPKVDEWLMDEEHKADRKEMMQAVLVQHAYGDWGNISDSDARRNDEALLTGERVFSYWQIGDQRLWVITDAVSDSGEREVTTILEPSDDDR